MENEKFNSEFKNLGEKKKKKMLEGRAGKIFEADVS